MNWKKISKKYPKAFDLFFEWFKGSPKAVMTRAEFIEVNDIVVMHGNIRELYDFFDKHHIFISVDLFCEGWHISLSKSCEEHFYIENRRLGTYKTRTEAEKQGFSVAFEILEKQGGLYEKTRSKNS